MNLWIIIIYYIILYNIYYYNKLSLNLKKKKKFDYQIIIYR